MNTKENRSNGDTALRHWIETIAERIGPWEIEQPFPESDEIDAFSRDLEFGTGGIRCLMGIGPNRMNSLTIGKAAQGVANWLNGVHGHTNVAVRPAAVICYDTRIHSKLFAQVAADVLAANGLLVWLFDSPQPTPLLSFAVRNLGCEAGICITASHNSKEWNGFKVYDSDGVQATDAMVRGIQGCIREVDPFEGVISMDHRQACDDGVILPVGREVHEAYYRELIACRLGIDCANMRVVYSPLNGVGNELSQRMLQELGAEVLPVDAQVAPDGTFPSCPYPNPENPDAMALGMQQMESEHAALFLATDPDADRVGVACMHNGKAHLITGDEVGLLILDWIACHTLAHDDRRSVAVSTIVSSPLADAIALEQGIELRRTLTGFKYIGEQIGPIEREGKRFLLGFEESDGYLRGSYVRDKDGINAAMLVCEIASAYRTQGKDLVDALNEIYERYGYVKGKQLNLTLDSYAQLDASSRIMTSLRNAAPRTLGNMSINRIVDYAGKTCMPTLGGKAAQVLPTANVLQWDLENGSRVLVRPSGTEPKIKAYVFARDATSAGVQARLDALCSEVRLLLQQRNEEGRQA